MMKRVITVLLVLVLLGVLAAGGWTYYDNNVDRSGWAEENGERHYLDFHGKKMTGWQKIGQDTYYFGEDGNLRRLWQEIDGNRYYLGTDGILTTSWQEIDGSRYYFDNDGILQTGWLTMEKDRYYLAADGAMVTSWQEVEGKRRYFSNQGRLQTGWQEIRDVWYFLDEEGCPLTGSRSMDGETYFFGEDGAMATGWVDDRYYREDGTMVVGWQQIGGGQYFFREDGSRYTGWMEEGEYRYYFREDGAMAVGPTEIDGRTYHFSPRGVQIWLVNSWNEIPEDYTVEMTVSEGGFRVANVCYDALTRMLADSRTAGCNPELASGYRTYWDQYAMYMDAVKKYGTAKGSQIAALPNTSEHHLGLAVDILVPGSNVSNKSGEMAVLQAWLMEHCWDYGFILRYPEGTTEITGIIYEPWHYRYVGVEVAREMKELGITLEEYLGAVQKEVTEG